MGAVVQLVEYRTGNREVAGSSTTHTRSTASNLDQVANLLCARANSTSYPQRDGKSVVATATGRRPSVADWGDVVSAICTVGPNDGQWMADGHIMRCGTITIDSCQSAATSEIVKRSAAGHESDSCKWRYSKCPDLYLYLYTTCRLAATSK